MTVRITSPGASRRAASGVRGSSARAERIIVIRVCRQASVLSSFTRDSDAAALPKRTKLTMLLKAMIGKRHHIHAADTTLSITGLRALALLLP